MNTQRFESGAARYAEFRPRYPDSILADLAARIRSVEAPHDSPVVDVGSGTGIFTRQLRGVLPDAIPIVGVEPAQAMREEAQRGAGDRIAYVDGTAEALPVASASARAIVAATAAHWFDRPRFYASAANALVASGLLAIVEYVRDEETSPAARAVVAFLNEHGEPRAYARPDYLSELRAAGFRSVDVVGERRTLLLTMAEFVGLALSSSHARHAIARMGRAGAEAEVGRIGANLTNGAGFVPFGYIFQMFVAR